MAYSRQEFALELKEKIRRKESIKYSSEKYGSSELFQGHQYLDGTIEGAMMAGLKAYPV